MTEIEYRAERAQHYLQFIDTNDYLVKWEWCIFVGLWETSFFVNNEYALKWLNPDYKDI